MVAPPLPFDVDHTPGSAPDRLVLIHNWPQGPRSFEGRPAASDYYATGYLSPTGEKSKHIGYGGLVRDRPEESPNLDAWRTSRAAGELADQRTDIADMVAAGADGTLLDLLSIAPTSDNTRRQRAHLQAAAEHATFTVALQPDMNASGVVGATAATLAAYVVALAKHGGRATHREADGRLVVAPFKAEAWPPAKWAQFADECAKLGERVSFWFVLVNFPGRWAEYAAVPGCRALGPWGERTIAGAARMVQAGRDVKALGKRYIAPVAVQDVRPSQRKAWESHGLGAALALTEAAITAGADVLMWCTANDTTESTNVLPSVNAGWSRMAMVAWCSAWFRKGTPPVVVRGGEVVSQRTHSVTMVPTQQTERAVWQGTAGVDIRETLTFTPGKDMTRRVDPVTFPAGIRLPFEDLTYHSTMTVDPAPVDPRDARIAELETEVVRLTTEISDLRELQDDTVRERDDAVRQIADYDHRLDTIAGIAARTTP